MNPGRIVRYGFRERLIHAVAGLSYVYLLLTGLAFWTPALYWIAVMLGGGFLSRILHPWIGLVFAGAVVGMSGGWWRDMRITADDKRWRRAMGRYIRNEDASVPPAGRFNYGQKMLFWVMLWGGVVLLASGLVMWFVPVRIDGASDGRAARPCHRGARHHRRVHRARVHGHRRRAGRVARHRPWRRERDVGTASPSGLAQALVSVPVGPAFQAGRWDERIARARSLADGSPASAILTFYAELADFQRRAARSIATPDGLNQNGFQAVVDAAAGSLADFLQWLQHRAPSPLAQAAREGGARSVDEWRELLRQRILGVHGDEDGPTAFVVEALLQPFMERAAQAARLKADVRLKADATYAARCPMCGSAPVAAALREEGQGARRSLVCSLCFTEWDYLRIHCPACEENRFDALPVYTADAPAAVRIDACDSCRMYIKTIDLTKDGLAVPTVDDLASLPLDLWARERGYQRLYPNLLRL